jgi:hypothetical protein
MKLMLLRRSVVGAVVLGIASAFLWASTAISATLTIGIATGAGPLPAPIAVAGPSVGNVAFSSLASFDVFTTTQITATGGPLPNILGSTSLNVASSGPGTLRVYVTSQGNTDVNNGSWISTFTSDSLPSGWQVREQTFIDPGNGLFTLTTQLGNAVFNAVGTSVASTVAASGNNYSVTHLYTIIASSAGSALSTINLEGSLAVPGPLAGAGLPGLLAACGGLVFLTRRRRRKLA